MLKKSIYTLIFLNFLYANEFNLNLSEENLNNINNKKQNIKEKVEKEIFQKEIEKKLKIIKKEKEEIIQRTKELNEKKINLDMKEKRLILFEKKLERKIISKSIRAFSKVKDGVAAEIIAEMYKNDVEATIKLLIMLEEKKITKIIKKMESEDSSKIMKELLKYKQNL